MIKGQRLLSSIMQVRWNLFTNFTVSHSGESGRHSNTKFFQCREVEENYRRGLAAVEPSDRKLTLLIHVYSPCTCIVDNVWCTGVFPIKVENMHDFMYNLNSIHLNSPYTDTKVFQSWSSWYKYTGCSKSRWTCK